MEKSTRNMLYNISISVGGDDRLAKELMAVYISEGRAALAGRKEAVDEAVSAVCVYTGDDEAADCFVRIYLSEAEEKADINHVRKRLEDEALTACLVLADSMLPDNGSGVRANDFVMIGGRPAKKRRQSGYGTSTDSKTKEKHRVERKTNQEKKNNESHEIPVLIMGDEMISLENSDSLKLGTDFLGLTDEFKDIENKDGNEPDVEFMRDFCSFVFIHGIVERYQRLLGEKITCSPIFSGVADDSWLEALQGMSRAVALLEGRNYVLPSDVDFAAVSVSAAYVRLAPDAYAKGYSFAGEIARLTEAIVDPDQKERI